MPAARPRAENAGPRLSIGALSRATGIPVETLRTWESRYGYPVPVRKPSGHRVYPVSSVPRLRRVAEALARGLRASEVVAASEDDLTSLLESTTGAVRAASEPAGAGAAAPDLASLLKAVKTFDADRLTRALLVEWARLGPLGFLGVCVAPLIRAVGDEWESGRMEIRHEHFLSERVGDLLRSLRLSFEGQGTGPLIVLASLPGEAHGLGLQMAALILASAGCRILFLGTEVPPAQMVSLVKDLGARALAVSVSEANGGPAVTQQLRRLRDALPRRTTLLVGGNGAPDPRPGMEVIRNFPLLERWGRALTATARA